MTCLDQTNLDQLFRNARSHSVWTPRAVAEALIEEVYDLAKWGPTSANVSPGRFTFVVSRPAKERLLPHVSSANRLKTSQAPVTVIVGFDLAFARHIPQLFPHNPGAASWFANAAVAEETAFRNGTLQGAYLMLAARALGLDCGPMSGFDAEGVNRAFFAETSVRANFLCNIGYGDAAALQPRLPRLAFSDACKIL
jgi:3-hydroxypropanoate dehydrogenase